MARIVKEKTESNPRVLGEDVMQLLIEGLGVASTAVVGDRITAPLVHQVIPGAVDENGMFGKIVDAGAAFGTAWVLGEAVGMADRQYGRLIRRGGVLLGVAKIAGAVVPGYTLSSLPNVVSGFIPSPFAQKELPAANGAPARDLTTVRQVGRSGL